MSSLSPWALHFLGPGRLVLGSVGGSWLSFIPDVRFPRYCSINRCCSSLSLNRDGPTQGTSFPQGLVGALVARWVGVTVDTQADRFFP